MVTVAQYERKLTNAAAAKRRKSQSFFSVLHTSVFRNPIPTILYKYHEISII
jgi:hypothetical protein